MAGLLLGGAGPQEPGRGSELVAGPAGLGAPGGLGGLGGFGARGWLAAAAAACAWACPWERGDSTRATSGAFSSSLTMSRAYGRSSSLMELIVPIRYMSTFSYSTRCCTTS